MYRYANPYFTVHGAQIWGFGWLGWALLIIAVAAIAVAIVALRRSSPKGRDIDAELDRLVDRYVAGEIDREQFKRLAHGLER